MEILEEIKKAIEQLELTDRKLKDAQWHLEYNIRKIPYAERKCLVLDHVLSYEKAFIDSVTLKDLMEYEM